jgi:hypothetical protein
VARPALKVGFHQSSKPHQRTMGWELLPATATAEAGGRNGTADGRGASSLHLRSSSTSSRHRAASSPSFGQVTSWSTGEDVQEVGMEMWREPLGEEALGLERGGRR